MVQITDLIPAFKLPGEATDNDLRDHFDANKALKPGEIAMTLHCAGAFLATVGRNYSPKSPEYKGVEKAIADYFLAYFSDTEPFQNGRFAEGERKLAEMFHI